MGLSCRLNVTLQLTTSVRFCERWVVIVAVLMKWLFAPVFLWCTPPYF
jgi:hypothetical protein